MDKRQQQFSPGYIAITFFLLFALQSLLAQGQIHGMAYSKETAQAIDRGVRHIVDEEHQRVRTLLTQQNGKLERLAKALLEREVLEGDDLRRLLAAA